MHPVKDACISTGKRDIYTMPDFRNVLRKVPVRAKLAELEAPRCQRLRGKAAGWLTKEIDVGVSICD